MQDTADTVVGFSVFSWGRLLNLLMLNMVPLIGSLYKYARDPMRAIGLVSSCAYHAATQGDVIGRCTLLSDGEAVAELPLIRGDKSVRIDYDFEPAFQKHQKIAIIDSEEADYLDVISVSFQRHKYTAPLAVLGSIVRDTLVPKMLSRGTLDVFDVVLQPEST